MLHIHTVTLEGVAREIIEQAKRIIPEELAHGLTVSQKADKTPVTQIDLRINDVAVELISRSFPGDAIYAEEGNGGTGTSGYTWVIDPIDGTRALALGMPTYTVCIARVAPDGQADFSFVYNPSTDELFAVRRGERATKNEQQLAVAGNVHGLDGQQVYVTSRLPAAAVARGVHARFEAAGAERLNSHSLAFGVLLVAEGKIAAAVTGASEPYEFASVKAIVEAAGGVVSDLNGWPIDRCDAKLDGFIAAANETVLREIVELYQSTESQAHQATIRQYSPQASHIQPVKSGYVNDVYIVDERSVFRFPKSSEWREMLLFEAAVLKKLEGRVTLAVPTVQHVASGGRYAVFSYIRGVHRSSAEIRHMSKGAQRSFAEDMATFLVELNDAVPTDWMKRRLVGLPVERKDDAAYYAELLELGRKNNNPYVKQYEERYEQLMTVRDDVFSSDEIVIHGDLHSGNFIFDESDRLAGIFDFGDCMLNTVYFELRQIYQFGDDILEMMIAALGGRFGAVSKDAVRLLAVTHEFSILMRLGSSAETPYDNERSKIAKKLLERWGELR